MGITDPAEEYFKDGLWGYVTSAWEKLVATAGGALHVYLAGSGADQEVVQPTAHQLHTTISGYDGGTTRRLALLWGYTSPWRQVVTGAASGAGDATCGTTAVPEGYVYVLQGVSVYQNSGASKDTRVYAYDGTVALDLLPRGAHDTEVLRAWHGEVLLAEDDVLTAYCWAPGDTKIVSLRAWGYKMDIEM